MAFIALEGIDGSGTTTQAARLQRWLTAQGRVVHRAREPSDLDIGRYTRSLLQPGAPALDKRAVALLFAADRLDHVAREIEPALERGHVVISDRYVLSSLAYQSLDCPADWVANINRFAREPSLTMLLRVDPDVAAGRMKSRGGPEELFDALPLQRRVAAAYDALAEAHGALIIDGERDVDEVEATIREAVSRVL